MPSTDLEVAPKTTAAKTFKTAAYAAQSATDPLAPFSFARREPGPKDVQIDILYCGVCHSDLHQVRNDWENVLPTVATSLRAGTRDSSGGSARWARRSRNSKRAISPLSDAWWAPAACARTAAKASNSTARRSPPSRTTGRQRGPRRGHLRWLLEEYCRRRRVCAESIQPGGPCRDRTPALRRHHDVFAAASLECAQGAEGRDRWVRRSSATWA